jgi:hypothetical protein
LVMISEGTLVGSLGWWKKRIGDQFTKHALD